MKEEMLEEIMRAGITALKVMSIIFIMTLLMLRCFDREAYAAGPVYEVGKDLTKPMGCTNPTARTDGTPLAATEIGKVEIYLTKQTTLPATPEFTHVMTGGCKDGSFDLAPLTPGQWHQFGKTFDTGGRVSVSSIDYPFVYAVIAPPGPPTAIK